MIKCNVCGHDNPLGRVHCVQCGTKIDLSQVVPEGMKAGKGAVVIKKVRSGSGGGASLGKTIIKLIDLAIIAALIIGVLLMWQETTVKEISTDTAMALAAKSKMDGLIAAQQAKAPMTVDFNEQEVNSYINDPTSPKHFEYTADPGGAFSSRFAKYQIELGENQLTAVAVGELRMKDYKKRIIMRVSGSVADGVAGKQLKLTTGFIGKLPLHALPFGDKIVEAFGGYFFRFQVFDQEIAALKVAREIRMAGGKATVSLGAATQ